MDAVRQARASLQPARVGFGTGLSYLNVNRDTVSDETHLWTQAGNPDGPSDKTVATDAPPESPNRGSETSLAATCRPWTSRGRRLS